MVTYHGSTVDLRFSRIAAEGPILKEYLGLLSGGGVDQVFTTKHFPITDNAGTATNAETNVNVYTRVTTGATWVTLSNASENDFAIVGATGTVTVKAAKNAGGDAGKAVSIDYWTDETLARGQGASVDFARDKEVIHQLGDPAPQEIKTGHWAVSGSIDSLVSNNDAVTAGLSESDLYKLPPDFSLYIYPNKNVTLQPYFKVTNVVFTDIAVKAPLKGMMAVSLKYSGLLLAEGANP